LNLEPFNALDWGDEARTALDGWRQGDLVETGKTLLWIGPGGSDPITSTAGGDPLADRVLVIAKQPEGTGFSVITSQTCDVIGEGPGSTQPWVQVSPVCRIPDADTNLIAQIHDRRALNYFKVTGMKLEGFYAADLRLSQPISKAVLLEQKPRRAFDETLAPVFAEQLSMKAGRVSLHDLLSDSLARALGSMVASEVKAGTWPAYVEQFRIGISQGTALNPLAFYLLAVTEVDATADVTKKIERCFERWKKDSRAELRRANIVPGKVVVRDLAGLPIATYRNTFPLAIREVSSRFWY